MNPKERRLFTKESNLDWAKIKVALAYRAITGKTSIRSIRWTKRHWDEYQSSVLLRRGGMPETRRRVSERFILKELISQGWVPLEEFQMKLKTGWYAYLMTSRKLFGKHYIYPEHFANDYRAHKKGYKYINEALNSGLGHEGYTRIYYTAYKNGIAK